MLLGLDLSINLRSVVDQNHVYPRDGKRQRYCCCNKTTQKSKERQSNRLALSKDCLNPQSKMTKQKVF